MLNKQLFATLLMGLSVSGAFAMQPEKEDLTFFVTTISNLMPDKRIGFYFSKSNELVRGGNPSPTAVWPINKEGDFLEIYTDKGHFEFALIDSTHGLLEFYPWAAGVRKTAGQVPVGKKIRVIVDQNGQVKLEEAQ